MNIQKGINIMNKRQIVSSLNKLANELDKNGMYQEANNLTEVMNKLALFNFKNPFSKDDDNSEKENSGSNAFVDFMQILTFNDLIKYGNKYYDSPPEEANESQEKNDIHRLRKLAVYFAHGLGRLTEERKGMYGRSDFYLSSPEIYNARSLKEIYEVINEGFEDLTKTFGSETTKLKTEEMKLKSILFSYVAMHFRKIDDHIQRSRMYGMPPNSGDAEKYREDR